MREEPLFTKCCWCIPLQFCLHAWVGFKIVADVALAMCFAFFTILIVGLSHINLTGEFYTYMVIIGILVVDGSLMIALSVGLCMKSVKVVKIFFYYSITMMVLVALILTLMYIFVFCHITYSTTILFPVCSVGYLCLDIGIALTAKSEMIKLRNKEQFDFVKMPGHCTDSQRTQEVSIEIENIGYS